MIVLDSDDLGIVCRKIKKSSGTIKVKDIEKKRFHKINKNFRKMIFELDAFVKKQNSCSPVVRKYSEKVQDDDVKGIKNSHKTTSNLSLHYVEYLEKKTTKDLNKSRRSNINQKLAKQYTVVVNKNDESSFNFINKDVSLFSISTKDETFAKGSLNNVPLMQVNNSNILGEIKQNASLYLNNESIRNEVDSFMDSHTIQNKNSQIINYNKSKSYNYKNLFEDQNLENQNNDDDDDTWSFHDEYVDTEKEPLRYVMIDNKGNFLIPDIKKSLVTNEQKDDDDINKELSNLTLKAKRTYSRLKSNNTLEKIDEKSEQSSSDKNKLLRDQSNKKKTLNENSEKLIQQINISNDTLLLSYHCKSENNSKQLSSLSVENSSKFIINSEQKPFNNEKNYYEVDKFNSVNNTSILNDDTGVNNFLLTLNPDSSNFLLNN